MKQRSTIVLCALIIAASLGAAATARADAYLRVIAQQAPIHTGPGPSYREVYVAERGEVFQVLERGTKGFWFRVELEDGTTGWIFGELVFPYEVVDQDNPGVFTRMWRSTRKAILGPSPVPYSNVEVSFSAGVLDTEGIFVLRPAYLIDKYFALEGFLGLSPRAQLNVFLGGLGWTLRLIPGAAMGPYLNAGVGFAHRQPKADNFTDDKQTLFALAAGGGFEITFKKQITLRVDFRNWTVFDPNEASNGQEFSGGLAIFF